MSSTIDSPPAVASPAAWWSQPMPVIFLFTGFIVLLCFIEKFDWPAIINADFSRSNGPAIASGTLYSVRYDLGGGRVGGITRSRALHDGVSGDTNVDMRATLTREALVIHRLKRYEGGKTPVYETANPQVIPFDRIYEVQFGDRGIVLPDQHPINDHSHSH